MPLSDGVFFGIGFIYNYQSREIDTKYSNINKTVNIVSSLNAAGQPSLQSDTDNNK